MRMTGLVQLEDIEEFELVRRVPRDAITDDILAGVRGLSETQEIEPFLRQILADKTETPHTSTEKADILTTHVTRLGQPRLTAFVNKGRATRQVSARQVAHQIVRLGDIKNVSLMVLLAVGHIQDDVWNVLAATAAGANADYLVIDATDVARLFIAYHKICPKDGTPYAGGRCRRCGASKSEPIELTLRAYEEPYYEVHSQDVSTGFAKRYQADIVTAPHYSRAALREVIKQATWELRHSSFSRSEQVEACFGDQPADCAFLFVYPSAQDAQQTNWRCRAAWVRPDLPEAARPLGWGGDEWLGDIEIDWNADYYARRDYGVKRLGKKEEWVRRVKGLVPVADKLAQQTAHLTTGYRQRQLGQHELETALGQLEPEARQLVRQVGEGNWPPPDCQQCDAALRAMLGSLHNMLVPFATQGQAGWDWEQKLRLLESARQQYDQNKERFQYELQKLGLTR